MVEWGEKIRKTDPTYFCSKIKKPFNFVTDCRRMSDVKYFKENSKEVCLLKIVASEKSRIKRGWGFTEGIDDMETECGLDGLIPDGIIKNDGGTDKELLGQFEMFLMFFDKSHQ